MVQPSAELFKRHLNEFLGDRHGVNAALARHCGVDPSLVTHWRKGRNLPTIEMLDLIATFVGKPVASFFDDDTDSRLETVDIDKAIKIVTEAAKKGSSQ